MKKLPLYIKFKLKHALSSAEEAARRKGLEAAFRFELTQLREVVDEALEKGSLPLAEEALGFADSVKCQIRYVTEKSGLLLR